MALSCFPNLPSKQLRLSDGTTYGFVHVRPSPASRKPTFLLLHGFPSTSWDWRRQIHVLAAEGYGVLAPDLLGYGDTDCPLEVEKYGLKRMAGQIAEILKREGVGKVIGVGHDW